MNFLRSCVSFRGRLNRGRYIALSSATLAPLALVALLEKASDNSGPAMLIALAVVGLTLWIALASLVKRFHDIGWSGLACLMVFIPGVGGFVPLILLFLPGNDGGNDHGEPCEALF